MAKKATDRLIQKVQINLDGTDWRLVITHNTLIECEDLTGLNLLTGEVNIIRPSAKLVRALLYLSLKHAGAKYTLEQVGEMITPQNIVAVQEGLLSAWAASMPDAEANKENPTKARSKAASNLAEAWSIARHDLGLSSREWLDMTPRHLHALRVRQEQKMQREELLVGILASSTVNSGFCRPAHPVTAESFMLHPFPPAPEKPVTGEDIMLAFARIPKAKP